MKPAGRLFFNAEGDIKAIHRFDSDAPDDSPEVFSIQAYADSGKQVEDNDTDMYADVVYPFDEEDRHAAIVLITAIMSEVYHSVMGMSAETISATVELHIAAFQLMDLAMLNQVFYEVMYPQDEGETNGVTKKESSSEESRSETGSEESRSETGSEESRSEATNAQEARSEKSSGEESCSEKIDTGSLKGG